MPQHSRGGKRAGRIGLCAGLIGCLLFIGCQTRLLGNRTSDFPAPSEAPNGVPFRMSKPLYALVPHSDSKGKHDGYDLLVEYVTDNSVVYWLNVQPGSFHENEFSMSFLETGHGMLSKVTSKGADKSKGFITALGGFAIGALGVYGMVAGDAAYERALGVGATAVAGMMLKPLFETPAELTQATEGEVLDALKVTSLATPAAAEFDDQKLQEIAALVAGKGAPTELTVAEAAQLEKDLREHLEKERERLSKAFTDQTGAQITNLNQYKKAIEQIRVGVTSYAPTGTLQQQTEAKQRALTIARKLVVVLYALANLNAMLGKDWQKMLVKKRWDELKAQWKRDALSGETKRTKAYRETEARLYLALNHPDLLAQRKTLEQLMEKELYNNWRGRANPDGVSQVTELDLARKQLDAIEAVAAKKLASYITKIRPRVKQKKSVPEPFLGSRKGTMYPLVVHYNAEICNPGRRPLTEWLKDYVNEYLKNNKERWNQKEPYVILIEDDVLNQHLPGCGIPDEIKPHARRCVR